MKFLPANFYQLSPFFAPFTPISYFSVELVDIHPLFLYNIRKCRLPFGALYG